MGFKRRFRRTQHEPLQLLGMLPCPECQATTAQWQEVTGDEPNLPPHPPGEPWRYKTICSGCGTPRLLGPILDE